MNQIIPYNPELKEIAKKLRSNMTLSEVLLWKKIRNKSLGVDFDRQKPLNNYIVDFYCKELNLAIEIDGNSHNHLEIYTNDQTRQKTLESLGVTFLRFQDIEVKQKLNQVIHCIINWIEQNKK
jgi:very-short-patch-repair endonuclease